MPGTRALRIALLVVVAVLGGGRAPAQAQAQATRERPEVRGAELQVQGKPIYLVGVWIGSTVSTSPSLHKPELDGDHPAYARPLSAETAAALGITSAHPPLSPLRVQRTTGWFKEDQHTQRRWDDLQAFLRGLKGMPLVADCAGISAFGAESVPPELRQANPGWHAFVPLCPEHPDGWRVYEDYWKDAARQIVEAGATAVIYEIFNEPAYDCRCSYNKREFARRMQKRYETVARANGVWKTAFESFDDVAAMGSPTQTPGLWCDWVKFIGDRYVEVVRGAKTAILSVDPGRPLYFVDQPSVSTTYLRCNGIDPVKVNAEMDVVGMEGGVPFGVSRPRAEADPMAAVFGDKGLFSHALYLDMARAFGKPVVNTETYCGRFYEGVRFPSHREDLVTELWEEMIHGACGSFFYNWGRRWWEWRDLAGAKKAAREVGYKAFSMLNPYAYPPDSLGGLADFQADLAKVGADLLAGPRIDGQVSLVISQPTARQLYRTRPYTEKGPYEEIVREWYAALTLLQVPVDVVWEEQLAATALARYRAVVAPAMTHAYRQSEAPLREYARGGGLLLSTDGALAMDEYGEPWHGAAEDAAGPMAVGARFLPAELRGAELRARLSQELFPRGDFRCFALRLADDPAEPLVCEAYRLRRSTGDYYYLVNWGQESRLVRLQVTEPVGDIVTAPLAGAVYAEGRLEGEGVLLHLPSQVRILVLVAKPGWRPAAGTARWTEADVRDRHGAALRTERQELEAARAELEAERRASQERSVTFDGPLADTGEYRPDDRTALLLHLNGRIEEPCEYEAGPVRFVDGKFGTQALHVGPGARLRFRLPAGFGTRAGSLELWARPDWPAADGQRHTVAEIKGPGEWNQNTLMLYKNANYEVSFVAYGASGLALAAKVPINVLQEGRWTHLCGTWDTEKGLKLYVDGEVRAETEGRLVLDRLDTVTLGNATSAERPWVGAVEEFRLSTGERRAAGGAEGGSGPP